MGSDLIVTCRICSGMAIFVDGDNPIENGWSDVSSFGIIDKDGKSRHCGYCPDHARED